MKANEGLLKVNEIDVKLPLPLSALLDETTECKYLLCTSFTFSKTYLFIAKLLVHCTLKSLNENFSLVFYLELIRM